MFVNVYTDIGKSRPVILTAKVVEREGQNFKIQYLCPSGDKYNGKPLYQYEDIVYTVDEESITECHDENDEECIGYKKVEFGFIEESSDSSSEYQPSCSDIESESESMYEDESEKSEDEYYEQLDDENFQDYD